jgi:predicted DNA-binding transcriptional regulator AlpA
MAGKIRARPERATITLNEVAALFGVNRLTILRWVEKELFPKPIQVGEVAKIWSRKVIMDKLEGK